MQKEDLKNLSREQIERLICEWAVKYHDLYNKTLKFEQENSRLEEAVRSHREKIDSLMKELEEEKGKTINISDGGITMRADMLEILNENKALKDENKSLKQQNDYLKNIFEAAYIPESAESMLRKTGFSQEVIDNAKERIESLKKELKAENTAPKQRIKDLEDICDGSCFSKSEDDRDKLIAELQDQRQQDCIKINQLHVTIDTLVDKYSRIRKTVGMD